MLSALAVALEDVPRATPAADFWVVRGRANVLARACAQIAEAEHTVAIGLMGDDDALLILRNCRRAMGPGARLLVVERALQQVDALSTAVHDLTMLVLFGGRDRTVDGYRALLERAGFEVARTARGASGICLLEACPGQESASSPR